MKKFQRLEAIRGFTALFVLIHHIVIFAPEANNKLSILNHPIITNNGRIPVLLFFILSGIVIQYSFHYAQDKSFKLYFFKRATRIYIPLFALWVVTPILQYLQQGYVLGYGVMTSIGNLFMLQDIGGYDTRSFPPLFDNHSLWSLSYEWWYYMFFYFITVKVKSFNINYIVYPLIILGFILSPYLPYLFLRWIDLFIFWWIGREIALLHIKNKKITISNLRLPLSCILLGIAIHYYKGTHGIFLEDSQAIVFTIMLFVIVVGIIWHNMHWIFFDYILGPFKKLSPISYGLYITHMALIVQANYLRFIENWYIRYALYIAICFAFSYFIERILYLRLTRYLKTKLL